MKLWQLGSCMQNRVVLSASQGKNMSMQFEAMAFQSASISEESANIIVGYEQKQALHYTVLVPPSTSFTSHWSATLDEMKCNHDN